LNRSPKSNPSPTPRPKFNSSPKAALRRDLGPRPNRKPTPMLSLNQKLGLSLKPKPRPRPVRRPSSSNESTNFTRS
jgi:hypothetical protein